MGAKKIFDFFSKSPEKKPKTKKLKIVERVVENKKDEGNNKSKNFEDKAIVQSLIDTLQKKLDDPETAKKASLIIQQMIEAEKK